MQKNWLQKWRREKISKMEEEDSDKKDTRWGLKRREKTYLVGWSFQPKKFSFIKYLSLLHHSISSIYKQTIGKTWPLRNFVKRLLIKIELLKVKNCVIFWYPASIWGIIFPKHIRFARSWADLKSNWITFQMTSNSSLTGKF